MDRACACRSTILAVCTQYRWHKTSAEVGGHQEHGMEEAAVGAVVPEELF